MRGMINGLSLLGQAGNLHNGFGNFGQLYPGLGYPGLVPGGAMTGMSPFGVSPWGGMPWAGAPWQVPGGYPSGQFPMTPDLTTLQGMGLASPYRRINQSLLRKLQGSWETDNGGLLLVEGRLARLYLERDRYQDLQLALNNHYLWIRPAGSAAADSERYQHRIFENQVILRDEIGRVLLLRRYEATGDSIFR